MDFDLGAENEGRATPKLSLHKLPSKLKEHHVVMFTPPNNTSAASIPFHWEEAPGKPRPNFSTKSLQSNNNISVARRLDLPPRLLNSITTTTTNHIDSSPVTVLDGPYDGSFMSLQDQILREERYGSLNFASWTWGSYKEYYNTGRFSADGFDFTSSLTTPLASKSRSCAKAPRRLKRSSTYSSISQVTSNLFAGIYGSFKRVVHWRRRQEQKKA